VITRSAEDASPTLAPEALRHQWGRQYAHIVLVLATAYEAFVLPRALTLGFRAVDAAIAILYIGLVALFALRATTETLVRYTLFAFGVAQVVAYVAVGFTGPGALIPCTLPVLAALFLGGRAPYGVLAASIAAFAVVGVLRVRTHVLPVPDGRLLDPRVTANWVALGLALMLVVGPVVWLASRVTTSVRRSFDGLAEANAVHEAQTRLRKAAEEALEKVVENRQRARDAEASGLLVAGVVHDLRNCLNVLQLAAGAFGGPSSTGDEREAAARIRATCAQASEATRELLGVSRPPEGGWRPTCVVGAQLASVAAILRSSLPVGFRVTVTSALPRDVRVGIDPYALTSAILEVASAAQVAASPERELGLGVRAPSADESASMSDCAAVVEIRLGSQRDAVQLRLPGAPAFMEGSNG
jgi:signal transduction histidine kinase